LSIPKRKVEDFFANEYLNYAKYVVENRAIPSVIDGFKPTQRKVAHVANGVWKTGNEKPLKVFQLAGTVAANAYYHHGNASLEGAIVGMAQDFKSSMPIFQGIGQFGSLRSPEAGAPRYVGVKFNENFRLLYKDFELTTPQFEEGEEIEPRFFLPIVPTVLLNGGSGIAVGFATNILNRNPLDLIDACVDVLDGKEIKVLKPWIRGFTGTFDVAPDNHKSWLIKGKYDIKNMSTVEITEVPPSFTYEKYESLLEGLVEKGTLHAYDDHTSGKIHYVLKFPRQTLAELIKKNKLEDVLKMQERETENYTTLDENGKLKVFDTIAEMVSYFVNFRLSYYDKRKARLLVDLQRELDILDARSKFVDAVIKRRIAVANEKKPDIIKAIEKEGIQKQDDSYEFLLGMPIWSLTYEKYNELQKKLDAKKKELDKVMKTTPEKMYRDDLSLLRTQVQKEFTI
jgi:DNA topoisomerase-2